MKNYLTVLLITVCLESTGEVMTPEILWKLGRVSEPQLSPDGSKALYNVRRFDVASNKGNSDIWLYDYSTNTSKVIASDSSNETSAKWSIDGRMVYYLNDKDGSQLWSMNADGSGKTRVSNLRDDITAFGISPDGSMIWFSMNVSLDKFNGNEKYKDLPKTSGRVYDDLMMRHWDHWADGTYSHIFVSSFAKGRISSDIKDIMKDEHFDTPMKPHGGDDEIAWSYDGKQLAYNCKKFTGKDYAVNTNSDIYLYDVASGKTTNLTEGMTGYDKFPAFSPDGTRIAWISWEKPANEASQQNLFVMDLGSKAKTNHTEAYDNNVENVKWSGKSDRIYFLSDINATDQIFYINVSSKTRSEPVQLTKDVADYNGLCVVTNGKTDKILASRMSLTLPTDVYSVDVSSGESKQLTFVNKDVLSSLKMPEVKKFMVRTTDNKDMLTWVLFPPDFDPNKKYPALLFCQGGPQNTLSQFFSYRWNLHLMAAGGYIVIAPNRRGLPGFGKEWNDKISTDWGGQAMKDLLSAVDSLAKQPYVDRNKLGAVGPSFGGYSVFWLAGNHEKRFKTFISHCGVFNLESMIATEELFFHLNEFDGEYWKNPVPVSYTKHSPHRYVQNWDTPILIIANEKDYRVPYTQSLEAYSAARLKNIPSRFLSFPDEGHWVVKPQNALMWQREFFGWLDKYLK